MTYQFAVVIPTFGRRDLVTETVRRMLLQAKHGVLVVSVSRVCDSPKLESPNLKIVHSPKKGSTHQRNAALRWVYSNKIRIICFLDDDVILAPNYFKNLLALHHLNTGVAGFSPAVIADGVKTGEINIPEACQIAGNYVIPDLSTSIIRRDDPYVGFSINQSVTGNLFFDERMSEYAFMEDWDFFARARTYGPTAHAPVSGLVHLGFQGGRCNSRKLGYAQIMNPIYLSRKGSLRGHECLKHLVKFFAKRVLNIYRREERARFYGGLIALLDLFLHGPSPERVILVS